MSISPSDILALLPDAVIVLGEGPRIEWLNRAAEGLVGTTLERAVGRPPGEVLIVRDASLRRLDECLPLGRRSPMSHGIPEGDFELVRTGGEQVPVSLMASYERDEAGYVRRVVLVLRNAKARRGMDMRTVELISTVSHEIRAPLTSVKGFTQTILRRWDLFDDDAKKDMLGAVNEDADRVKRLLDELLDVSRLESGRLKLRLGRVDLVALAAKLAEKLGSHSDSHQVQVDVDGEVPDVLADADKVEQVLTNLIENALKYTEGGRVTVSVHPVPDAVSVSVADQGEGVPARQLPHLFRKFYRRERAGSPTGTGLGLYICRRLVEAHGGELVASSAPGEGTTFTFNVPLEGPS